MAFIIARREYIYRLAYRRIEALEPFIERKDDLARTRETFNHEVFDFFLRFREID